MSQSMASTLNAVLLSTALLVSVNLNAQGKSTQPRSGIISGRVFLITADGELKVARMAKVYLMWRGRGGLNSPVDRESAGSRYMDQKSKELGQAVINLQASRHSSEEYCLEDLMVYDRAMEDVIKWSFEAKQSDQIRMLYTNEENGRFKFPDMRPGRYYLFAEGRAGLDQAVWEDPFVQLKPGESIEVKLSSFEKACRTAN